MRKKSVGDFFSLEYGSNLACPCLYSVQREQTKKYFHPRQSVTHFIWVGGANMNLTILLWSFVLLGSVSANFRGNFVPPKTNSTLVEGDIVVRETHLDSGKALDAFLTEETSL